MIDSFKANLHVTCTGWNLCASSAKSPDQVTRDSMSDFLGEHPRNPQIHGWSVESYHFLFWTCRENPAWNSMETKSCRVPEPLSWVFFAFKVGGSLSPSHNSCSDLKRLWLSNCVDTKRWKHPAPDRAPASPCRHRAVPRDSSEHLRQTPDVRSCSLLGWSPKRNKHWSKLAAWRMTWGATYTYHYLLGLGF